MTRPSSQGFVPAGRLGLGSSPAQRSPEEKQVHTAVLHGWLSHDRTSMTQLSVLPGSWGDVWGERRKVQAWVLSSAIWCPCAS